MSEPGQVSLPPSPIKLNGTYSTPTPSDSLWNRISNWAAENKAVVYTIAGVTLVVTGAGVYYYLLSDAPVSKPAPTTSGKKKKNKKKAKKEEDAGAGASIKSASQTATVTSTDLPDVEELSDEVIESLSEQDKKDLASKLKAAGNKAYGSKDYNRAIELYTKAIQLKQDPIFYSNRAACFQAMGEWDKVIEDTTAALNLDATYVKALNRRANAYEASQRYSDALLDYTASCIIDKFSNPSSQQKVEFLLQTVAGKKAEAMFAKKEKKLPSVAFVGNYLGSFRPKPLPVGLEETADIPKGSGKDVLREALITMRSRGAAEYNEASKKVEEALELNELGEFESLAYNLRATFRWLQGDNDDAMIDINKSIELDPSFAQSYIKRASMHLELMSPEKAQADFDEALKQAPEDPDIFYHRAQLHFIQGNFQEAAQDYQKSIDIDPEFIYSHIQLGVTQYKQGSVASSMSTFRRIIKKFQQVPDVYNYYGELLLDQKHFQKAVEQFETAIDLEKQIHPTGVNVLPLVNKALAIYQWKQNVEEAQELCRKALLLDEECDIAVATLAQLLLHQGNVTEALKCFERAAELSRTVGEVMNALQYAEATRTQLEVGQKYPQLAEHMRNMASMATPPEMY